jgi:hypothetical protein
MMILKLTNMSEEHKGNALLINSDHILTVYETVVAVPTEEVKKKQKTFEVVTNIFTTTQQLWTVKEPVDDIYDFIKLEEKKS